MGMCDQLEDVWWGQSATSSYSLSMGKGTRGLCSVFDHHIPSFNVNLLILGFLKTGTAAKQRRSLEREGSGISLLVRDQHFSLSTRLCTFMGEEDSTNPSTAFLAI